MNKEKIIITVVIIATLGMILISILTKDTPELQEVNSVGTQDEQVIVEEPQEETPITTNTTQSTSSQQTTNTTTTTTTNTNFGETTFTMAQVSSHGSDGDCYTVISGIVYDLTAWVHQHPGGDRNILMICGIDGTSAYNSQHVHDKGAQNILAGFEIGILVN